LLIPGKKINLKLHNEFYKHTKKQV
jgi:hypothetical protein